jgi:hypothetical protein
MNSISWEMTSRPFLIRGQKPIENESFLDHYYELIVNAFTNALIGNSSIVIDAI